VDTIIEKHVRAEDRASTKARYGAMLVKLNTQLKGKKGRAYDHEPERKYQTRTSKEVFETFKRCKFDEDDAFL